ncbi:12102_t:CDS:2 [Gigaspora margarita]|uniref:12102_t:CDS:1 n=1 Tax=Gigaspora margarita TaxID=4874 RepID=A0ABN7V8X9_GIGMA|nr:12102_t:CDS:2 [Gigaspora margarita]
MFLKRNIEEERRNLVFYMDGSLLGIEHNNSDRALIEYAYRENREGQILLQAVKRKKLFIRDKIYEII